MKTHRYIFEVEVITPDDCDCQVAHVELQRALEAFVDFDARVLGGARQASQSESPANSRNDSERNER